MCALESLNKLKFDYPDETPSRPGKPARKTSSKPVTQETEEVSCQTLFDKSHVILFSLLIGRSGADTVRLPQGVRGECTGHQAVRLSGSSRFSRLRLQGTHSAGIPDSDSGPGRKLAACRKRQEPHNHRVSTTLGEDARLSPPASHEARGFPPTI